MNPEKEAHIKAIKNRLLAIIKKSNFNNPHSLLSKLNNNSFYEINYDTLRNTLNYDKNSLDAICIVAICKYFNLDIAYVLSPPDNPASEIYNNESTYVSERYSILDDPKYMGKYYGYFYSPKKANQKVDSFTLEFITKNKKTVAQLNVDYHSINNDGQVRTINKVLEGTPIHVNPSSIYIVFTESSGQFNIMSFSYVPYNSNKLYFRRGAMITQGRDATRQPLMQSFVLFDKQLSSSEMEYVPGFLLLHDTFFHIKVSEMEELVEKHPEIASLYKDLRYIFEANTHQYYEVNEAQILNSVRDDVPKKDIVKAMLLMKGAASDAKRIYYPEIDAYSEFSKFLKKNN